MTLIDEDYSHVLLLLQECGGGEDPGMAASYLFFASMAAVTPVFSLLPNSAAWRLSSVAIGDAVEGERATCS
jgi:hypothetical protein